MFHYIAFIIDVLLSMTDMLREIYALGSIFAHAHGRASIVTLLYTYTHTYVPAP